MSCNRDIRADVDCGKGRQLGCQSFCCRLLVRLKPHEMEPSIDGMAAKGYVDKAEDGYCVHIDRVKGICRRWQSRPEACREYTCNGDPNLQIVLRYGITNIAEVAKRAASEYINTETYIKIPYLK